MKLLLTVGVIATFVLAAPLATASLIQSGSIVIDSSQLQTPKGDPSIQLLTNVLINPGFETGSLPPWTTNNWLVTSDDAHSGTYSAEDIGNYWVRQDFAPIPVGDINSISFWTKQPEEAIQAVDFYYSVTDYDEFLVFPGADWTFFDITGELRGVGSLQAIRIWGYTGGGPGADLTRIDDIVIDANVATPVEAGTWGLVKNSFR
jgi:hypothetical protein